MTIPDYTGKAVQPNEKMSRFVRSSGHFSNPLNRLTFRGFCPSPNHQLSVYRVDDNSGKEIWKIARDYVVKHLTDKPFNVKARGDFKGNIINQLDEELEHELHYIPNGVPHHRHANIVGWPIEVVDQRELAKELCKFTTLVCPPKIIEEDTNVDLF